MSTLKQLAEERHPVIPEALSEIKNFNIMQYEKQEAFIAGAQVSQKEEATRFLFWVWNNNYLPKPGNLSDTKWYDSEGKGFTHFELYDKFCNEK